MNPTVPWRIRQQAMPLPWRKQALPDSRSRALHPGIGVGVHADRFARTLLVIIPRKGIHRILLCLPLHQARDLILVSPILAALHRDYPGAQVDAIVTGDGAGSLFADFPNFGRAFELPRSAWLHPWAYLRMARSIRRERYDLTIDHEPDPEAGIRRLMRCSTNLRVKIKGA